MHSTGLSKSPQKSILKNGKARSPSKCESQRPEPSTRLVQRINQDFMNFKRHFSHSLGCQNVLVEEYVKNLMQQSELLSKEHQHLQRKLLEITQEFPALETESMKHVENYRILQRRIYDLELEEVRKDGLIHYLNEEIESFSHQVKMLESERRQAVVRSSGDCKQVESEQGALQQRQKKLEEQIYEIKKETSHFKGQTNYWEAKIKWLEHELQTYQREGDQLRHALEEKEVEEAATVKKLQVQEMWSNDIFHNQYPSGIDITALRDEIATLRSKVKTMELELETDRVNRLKLENNRTQLTQENAELLTQVAEAVQHLDLEKSLQSHSLIRCDDDHIRKYVTVKDSLAALMQLKAQVQQELSTIKEKNDALRYSANEWESLYFEKKSIEPLPNISKKQAMEMELLRLQAEVDTLKEQMVTFDRLMHSKTLQYDKLCSHAELMERNILEQNGFQLNTNIHNIVSTQDRV